MENRIITKEYLQSNLNEVFVFGDNTVGEGYGGSAILRDEPNTYGFVTKIYPNDEPESFFSVEEYRDIYEVEIHELKTVITANPNTKYLISKVGAGLANKNGIFEAVIEKKMKNDLAGLDNVEFLW